MKSFAGRNARRTRLDVGDEKRVDDDDGRELRSVLSLRHAAFHLQHFGPSVKFIGVCAVLYVLEVNTRHTTMWIWNQIGRIFFTLQWMQYPVGQGQGCGIVLNCLMDNRERQGQHFLQPNNWRIKGWAVYCSDEHIQKPISNKSLWSRRLQITICYTRPQALITWLPEKTYSKPEWHVWRSILPF